MVPSVLKEVQKASLHSAPASTSECGSHLSLRQELPRRLQVAKIFPGTRRQLAAACAPPARHSHGQMQLFGVNNDNIPSLF